MEAWLLQLPSAASVQHFTIAGSLVGKTPYMTTRYTVFHTVPIHVSVQNDQCKLPHSCELQGQHLFKNCYIEGTVDFVCGGATSIYEVS